MNEGKSGGAEVKVPIRLLPVRLMCCSMNNYLQGVKWLRVCGKNTREVIVKSGEQRLSIDA